MLRNKKHLMLTILFALTLCISKPAHAADINRLAGKDRISTANEVALNTFGKTDSVILVNGYGYADAVSAAPLSKLLDAPILLTRGDNIEDSVLNTIHNLKAKKVYIIGGKGVVSENIRQKLENENFNVTRYDGSKYNDNTRYGTNARIIEEVLKLNPYCTDGLLVNGYGYADALSATPVATMKRCPIIFANNQHVPLVIKNVINKKRIDVVAIGGSGVLPDKVINEINAHRIASDEDCRNRFDTNIFTLDFFKNSGEDKLNFNKIYIASGGYGGKIGDTLFADALVATAAASKTNSPVILSGVGASKNNIIKTNRFITDNMKDDSNICIIGGTSAIPKELEDNISNDIKKALEDLQVISIK